MDKTLSLLVKFAALDRLTAPLRAMSGGAKRAGRDLVATRKTIAELERTAGRIDGLRTLGVQADKTFADIDEGRRRIRGLQLAIAAATGPTGRLTAQMQAAERKVARLTETSSRQSERMKTLRGELTAAGVDVRDLAAAEVRLADKVAQANRQLERQQDRADRLAASQRRVQRAQELGGSIRNRGAAMAAGGVAIGAGGIALAADARGFQSVMVDIAQKANLGRRETAAMAAHLLKVAPRVAQLPVAMAQGVDALAGLGLDPRQATRIIAPLGRAATAYKAEMLDLANATYSSIDNLKVPVGQTARILDVMASAGKAGAFELKDMAGEFPALTAAAAGLGQKGVGAVADLAAALQIARKGAGDSSTAANNVLNLLNKINSNDAAKNFRKLGVDLPASLKRAYAEGKTPLEAIVELTRKATGGDTAKLGQLFEDAQVQAALRPLLANMDLYRQIRGDALRAAGTVERDFADRVAGDGTARQAKFNAQLERMKIVLGDQVLPILNSALERFGGMADRVSAWAQRNPQLAASLARFATVLAIVLTVLGTAGIAIGTVLPWIARGAAMFMRFGGVIGWVARVFFALAGAIGATVGLPAIAVAAIGVGLALAGKAIYDHWDKIKAFFAALPAWFVNIGRSIITSLIGGLKSQFPTLFAIASLIASKLPFGGGGGTAPPRPAVRPVTPARPVRAGGGGGGNTFHITQRPGEDGEALARRVAGHIDRKRGRDSRSSYRDDND